MLRHFSINTERTYVHWLGRYGRFLKDPGVKGFTAERKMETLLTTGSFGRRRRPKPGLQCLAVLLPGRFEG